MACQEKTDIREKRRSTGVCLMVDFKKLQTKAKGGEMSEYKIESEDL